MLKSIANLLVIIYCVMFLAFLLVGPGPRAEDEPPATGSMLPAKLKSEHLPNPVKIHEKVISGGLPEGDDAFQELADMGVKTIISVDGATPEVATARKHGLRYVHLPHGYDGIPDQRIKELAKAVRELEGPIYIHCHHGKHRSPAAAAAACVGAGLIGPDAALDILRIAGTSEKYRGLYEAVEEAQRFDDRLLDELKVEFRETVPVPPLAEAMVAMEHTHDHLKTLAAASWNAPPEHPDLEPPHEALLLREHFTELLRTGDVMSRPQRFQEQMREGETAGQELEDAILAWDKAGNSGSPPKAIAAAFERVTKSCATCHAEFRDVPLSKKGQE